MRIASREVTQATVLGYARTGEAVASFLARRGARVLVSERGILTANARRALDAAGIAHEEGGHSTAALETDLLVLSPGVPPTLALLAEAARRGIPVISELDLASLFIPPEIPIVAVTGTNGKSTTVELMGALLRASGRDTVVAGNIGTPAISILERPSLPEVLVLEASSFQLEQSLHLHPQVAVLLNLSPNHLDRHGTMEAYTAAKARLFERQTERDAAVLPRGLCATFPAGRARRVFFDEAPLSPLPFLAELAPHNRANLRAALAACAALFPDFAPSRVRREDLREALSLPFRLHLEGSVAGVDVLNDSKSTNAASTIAALASVPSPVVLILGGRHKGGGYEELARAIIARAVRSVVLYGEAAPLLAATLDVTGYGRAMECVDLRQAFAEALSVSRPGDTILLSPACSSFDQYKDYTKRGEDFAQIVRSHAAFTPI